MKKYYLKYAFEFIVIFLGILISLYFEQSRQNRVENERKNNSIEQLIKVIDQDLLQIENFTNCGENLVKDFFDLEYKKIILKRPLKYGKNYSNINYQVLGKTTRFDIYL